MGLGIRHSILGMFSYLLIFRIKEMYHSFGRCVFLGGGGCPWTSFPKKGTLGIGVN